MKKKSSANNMLIKAEIRLVEQLRGNPEILARLQAILELASTAEDPLKTMDEVEALLIQGVRQLGNTPMKEYATQAENQTEKCKW
jgi:hypothetical protein